MYTQAGRKGLLFFKKIFSHEMDGFRFLFSGGHKQFGSGQGGLDKG